MNELLESKVVDTYKEHRWHQSFHTDCSECYTEERARRRHIAKLREELGTSPSQYRTNIESINPNPLD